MQAAPDPVDFVMRSVQPMAERTFPFICSIVAIASENDGDHVGSAFRLSIGGRRALVTAKHVVDEAQRGLLGAGFTFVRGAPPQKLLRHPDLLDAEGDLAVFYLTEDETPSTGEVRFWPASAVDTNRTARAHDYLFLHGYPGERARFLFGGLQLRSLPYGAMERDDDLPAGTKPFEFAMDYDPSNMRLETGMQVSLVMPPGLGGSPVWRIGAYRRDPAQWTPSDALLVGVVTRWDQDKRVLLATEVGVLERLLQSAA